MAAVLPSWLGKDFAESSLKMFGSCEDLRVLSVDVQRATSPGDNYLSEVYRMRVELECGSKQRGIITAPLIIKTLPNVKEVCKLAQDMRAFEHETLMFTDTLPAKSRLLRAAAPSTFTRLSARCLASGHQPVSYLVLEDLRASGFKLAQRQCGLDLAHAKIVVRKLAEFHAASVALYEEDPSALKKHKNFLMFDVAIAEHLERLIKTGMPQIADHLESLEKNNAKYAPKLRELAKNLVERLEKLTAPKEGKFRVVNHADSWVNNMMFSYREGHVEDVALLDFQLSSFASPAVDLQYFMHTSLTEDVYANHLEQLVDEYHRHLVETMGDLGISAEKHISYEEFLEDFEEHTLYGMFAAFAVLPIVRTEEKTCFKVEALFDESESASNKSAYASASYMRALNLMLPVFERKGWL